MTISPDWVAFTVSAVLSARFAGVVASGPMDSYDKDRVTWAVLFGILAIVIGVRA